MTNIFNQQCFLYLQTFYNTLINRMNERLNNQKKHMSSKDLYFLPQIKHIKKPNNRYFSTEIQLSSIKYKTIEQIIQKSLNQNTKLLINQQSPSARIKLIDQRTNLYNKYEMLPKIYTKNNKMHSQKQQISNKMVVRQDSMLRTSFQINQKNIEDLNYYDRNSFNKRLKQQADKFSFSINYKFQEKQFFNHYDNGEIQEKSCNNIKKKYTKIITEDKQNIEEIKELQKVPDFLLKILDLKKNAQKCD